MSLDDVPVDAVGILWEQWIEQQRERIVAEPRAKRLAASGPSALCTIPDASGNEAFACISGSSGVADP